MVKPLATILVVLTLFVGPAAFAQAVSSPEPADPLPGQSGGTYADLVQRVAPGIVLDGDAYTGGHSLDIRHLAGWDEGVPLPEAGHLHISALPLDSRLVLLLDFGPTEYDVAEIAILALFDLADTPRLLDAANAGAQRWTGFFEPAHIPLGDDAGLLLTQSTHFNSSQGYATLTLTLARDGRLELIDMVSTLSENLCAYERTQSLEVKPAAAAPLADIVVVVTDETTPHAEPCSDAAPEPGTNEIAVTYHWDAAAGHYMPDSDAFEVLARENEARF